MDLIERDERIEEQDSKSTSKRNRTDPKVENVIRNSDSSRYLSGRDTENDDYDDDDDEPIREDDSLDDDNVNVRPEDDDDE